MAYTIAALVIDVRRILDEQGADDSGFSTLDVETSSGGTSSSYAGEADDRELDELIKGYVLDARSFVMGGCDAGLFSPDDLEVEGSDGTNTLGMDLNGDSGLTYVYAVIEDCLRVVRWDVDNFRRSITEFIDRGTPEYMALQDPLTTGTPWNPKGAVFPVYVSGSGMRTRVEAYCLDSADDDDPAGDIYYIKRYGDSDLTNDVHVASGPLRSAMRFYIAGLVCQSLNDQRSDNFIQLAVKYMGAEKGDDAHR